jgi:formate hydrogenlyase subunit 3/multisubunit Na+/H+ antiporter MnhD subunit
MNPEDLVFAPVILPLFGAALALCAKAFLQGRPARFLEYTGIFIGLALPWLVFVQTFPLILSGNIIKGVVGGWNPTIGITYGYDGLTWLVNILIFSIGIAAWLYAVGSGSKGPIFSTVFLIQMAAMSATILTSDLFNLFVCLEVMGITAYVLIAYSGKPGASLASFSYLMVSATAMIFYLLGLYGLYRLTGSISYAGIAKGLHELSDLGGITATVSLVMIVGAILVRVAIMPLHNWLPDAHALAPHAVSAVLSGVLIKVPLFALSRILIVVPQGMHIGEVLGYTGAFTALLGVILALSQKDAKRLLAYHSISQIGYVVSAWGMAIQVGLHSNLGMILITAAFLHAFYHALFKALLFLSIGTTVDRTGIRDVSVLRGSTAILKVYGEKFPITFICFLIGALAITAIPPFNGFASKTILAYALKGNLHYLLLTGASVGTVASFIKLSRIYWPRKKDTDVVDTVSAIDTIPRIHWTIHVSQAFLAILCVISGLAITTIFPFVLHMISGTGKDIGSSIQFYSAENLIKTLAITLGGLGLFILATSKPGNRILAVIRQQRHSFQGLFYSFVIGCVALVGLLIA